MQVVVEVKKWGNSLGIVVPKSEVKTLSLKVGEKVKVEILKKEKLDGFGLCKNAGKFVKEDVLEER